MLRILAVRTLGLTSLVALAGCAPSFGYGPGVGLGGPARLRLQLFGACPSYAGLHAPGVQSFSRSAAADVFRGMDRVAEIQSRYTAGYDPAQARQARMKRLATGAC